MPKQTFMNLPAGKREPILASALAEFSSHSYESASINVICREAGIPKGSFYQYFENKYDLYRYLLQAAVREKNTQLHTSLRHSAGKSVRIRFRELYSAGFAFSAAHPLLAELGNRFASETAPEVIDPIVKDAAEPSAEVFLALIREAQSSGEIRAELSAEHVLMLLFALNAQVAEIVKPARGAGMESEAASKADVLLDALLNMVFEGIG